MRRDEFRTLDTGDGPAWEVVVSPEAPEPRELVFVRRTRGWGPRFAVVRRASRPAGTLDDAALLDILKGSPEPTVVLARDLDAHRDNARECFQGMRAYHTSEIAHTGHALDLLKGVLVSTLALYGGLIGLAASSGTSPPGLRGTGVVFLVTRRLVGTAALSVAVLALIGCWALLLID